MSVELESIQHIKEFIGNKESSEYFERLMAIPWKQVKWGTGRTLPRLVFKYDDDFVVFPVLEELKGLIEMMYGRTVNGIFCNKYDNGKAWTPEHKDSYGGYVFTLSFGQKRRFYLKNDTTGNKKEYMLDSGDLIYFSPEIDACHKHCIPKTEAKDMQGTRISVVFFT